MMNDSTRLTRRSRRAWPRTARTTAAIIATAALVPLAAACSGSPSSAGSGGSPAAGGSTSSPSAVSYTQCIRTHGVPNFPDPPSNGGIAKASAQQLGVSSAKFQTAQKDCQRLIPGTGGATQQQEQQCYVASDCSPAVTQHMMNLALKFARCMRSHGEPNFPDPINSRGDVTFNISAHGISDAASHAPPFMAKLNECQRLAGSFPLGFE